MKRPGVVAYWAGAVVLVAFGYPMLFGYGAPFLLIGLAMAALWPVRRKPRIYWSAMVGVFAFIAGFVLAVPLGCSSSAVPALPGSTGPSAVGHTTCTNILGLDYSGPTPYRPSLVPALMAGVGAALLGAAAAWLVGGRIGKRVNPVNPT